jgi:predicted nucleic acid-binding protein
MIVVDSSVWIDRFRGLDNRNVRLLREHILRQNVIVGDAIVLELLQGCRTEKEAEHLSSSFGRFPISHMLSPGLAIKAAANYRLLRRRGITIRKTIDLIIGTFCIEHGHALLHADRDFLPMVEHLGLQLA